MNRLVLLFLIAHFYSSAQEKGITTVPVSGTVIFIKEQIVTDTLAYRKSTELLSEKMYVALRSTVEKERMKEGLEVDSLTLDGIISNVRQETHGNLYLELNEIDAGTYRFYNMFHGTVVNYCYTVDDQPEGVLVSYQISGGNKFLSNDEENGHLPVNIGSITEFRNEKKYINGYECFGVEITYKEPADGSYLDGFINNLTQHKKMWVTEKIKLPVHPVIYIPEILEKYYPMEIEETVDGVEGCKTIYKLEKFEIP